MLRKKSKWFFLEKIIIVAVAIAPIFWLAGQIDSDEAMKASIGSISAAVVMIMGAVLRHLYSGKSDE